MVIVVVLVLGAQARGAFGAEDPEALIHQGIELRRAGQDARAEGYFRRAYQLAATPRTAAQLGLVELAVGEYADAEAHLSEALGNADAWIRQNREALEESRALARKNLLRIEVVGAPADAKLQLDDGQPRSLPPGGVFWIAADKKVTVRIESAGHRAAIVGVVGDAGQSQRIVVDMPALAERRQAAVEEPASGTSPTSIAREGTETVEPVRSSGRALRIAGISVAATGVAAAVLGALFYERGVEKLHDYQAAIRNNGAWNPDDQNWEGTRNAGVALLVAGGVGLVGGAGLYLLGDRSEPPRASAVSIVTGPGLTFLSYRGAF